MTTAQQRLEFVESYLRNILKQIEAGDLVSASRDARLALQVLGKKP
jgi:hypothetical protein